MSALLFISTSVELSSSDDSFLAQVAQLVLQISFSGTPVREFELFPRESSPGVWDANPNLGLRDVSGEFVISVATKQDAEDAQVLGSMELNGPDIYDGVGKQHEIPLISREENLTLIVRTKLLGVENLRDLVSEVFDYKTPSGGTRKISITNKRIDTTPDEPGHTETLQGMDQEIFRLRRAVEMIPQDNPKYPAVLTQLGIFLHRRFERLGNISDLNHAISRMEQAADLTPDGDISRPTRMSNLGNSIETRFDRFGDLVDLSKAITLKQAAVDLSSNNHPQKPVLLNNLGNSLMKRYRRLGSLADIDNAITSKKAAVDLSSDDDPNKPTFLSNLGNSLELRFVNLGNRQDIDGAIISKHAALGLISDSSPQPNLLTNLGSSLMVRFQHFQDINDINEAIKLHQEAVDLVVDGHPVKPRYLNNLGNALGARFHAIRDPADNNAAISLHQTAVDLLPDGDPRKPDWSCNLGVSLISRFELSGNLTDLDDAIASNQLAVDLIPDSHLNKPTHLLALGGSLLRRFVHSNTIHDAEAAISHFSTAAISQTGLPVHRFQAAEAWASLTSSINSPSALDAYEYAISIIPLVAWLGLPIAGRHQHLARIGGVTRSAAATAISFGEYGKALEWLEQGRSIVWTQILQLRTPVNDLHDVEPDLAERLVRTSRLLDQQPEQNTSDIDMWSTEEERRRYRSLAMERESIIEDIRSLPRFENFLRPARESHLIKAAKNGAVVALNIAAERCDALAVVPGLDEVIHIPLPSISSERVTSLANGLKDALFSSGVRMRGERAAMKVEDVDGEEYCKHTLAELWNGVVKPVLDSLAFSPHPDILPRIWWCATGPLAFLPIHAAGIYDQGERNCHVGDYVISSYTPTLSSLIGPQGSVGVSTFKLLSVIQPSAPGASSLPNTKEELSCIRRHLSNREHVVLEGEEGTKNRVIKGMEDCNWLHLACHGIQRPDEPTKSALILEDGHLYLNEIIKLNLPKAEFAFLSACQTTTGDEKLSEEAVHIAGGMLLAGYRGVVATMWSIQDELAPEVADEFYAHVMQDEERPDSRKAAEALHISIQKLRRKGNIPLVAWIPFVHLGI